MKRTKQIRAVSLLILILLLVACAPLSNPAGISSTIADPVKSETGITAGLPAIISSEIPINGVKTPLITSTVVPSSTPIATPTELPIDTYIAYIQDEEIHVTHVVGGQPVDTRVYTEPGTNDWILKIGWSPSGEYISFLMFTPDSFHHLFLVNIIDGGPLIDLGIASDWAWSPDSKWIAFEHEYELWIYSPGGGKPRQLTNHLGTDWLWYQPEFTPSGDAIVAAGTFSNAMDRNGNTKYQLFRVPVDGSAVNSYPPTGLTAITDEISGRLPLDIQFSPDGKKLAMITSGYDGTCATYATYQIGNSDGSDLHELKVTSLAELGGIEQKMYFYGDSMAWTPESDGLWVTGLIRDCGKSFGIVGGPQISRVTLNGQEHEIIPGDYQQVSVDHTGNLLGVVNRWGVPLKSRVQILGWDGHVVLNLGEGDQPVLQP